MCEYTPVLEFLEILFWPYVFEDIILSFNLLLKFK